MIDPYIENRARHSVAAILASGIRERSSVGSLGVFRRFYDGSVMTAFPRSDRTGFNKNVLLASSDGYAYQLPFVKLPRDLREEFMRGVVRQNPFERFENPRLEEAVSGAASKVVKPRRSKKWTPIQKMQFLYRPPLAGSPEADYSIMTVLDEKGRYIDNLHGLMHSKYDPEVPRYLSLYLALPPEVREMLAVRPSRDKTIKIKKLLSGEGLGHLTVRYGEMPLTREEWERAQAAASAQVDAVRAGLAPPVVAVTEEHGDPVGSPQERQAAAEAAKTPISGPTMTDAEKTTLSDVESRLLTSVAGPVVAWQLSSEPYVVYDPNQMADDPSEIAEVRSDIFDTLTEYLEDAKESTYYSKTGLVESMEKVDGSDSAASAEDIEKALALLPHAGFDDLKRVYGHVWSEARRRRREVLRGRAQRILEAYLEQGSPEEALMDLPAFKRHVWKNLDKKPWEDDSEAREYMPPEGIAGPSYDDDRSGYVDDEDLEFLRETLREEVEATEAEADEQREAIIERAVEVVDEYLADLNSEDPYPDEETLRELMTSDLPLEPEEIADVLAQSDFEPSRVKNPSALTKAQRVARAENAHEDRLNEMRQRGWSGSKFQGGLEQSERMLADELSWIDAIPESEWASAPMRRLNPSASVAELLKALEGEINRMHAEYHGRVENPGTMAWIGTAIIEGMLSGLGFALGGVAFQWLSTTTKTVTTPAGMESWEAEAQEEMEAEAVENPGILINPPRPKPRRQSPGMNFG